LFLSSSPSVIYRQQLFFVLSRVASGYLNLYICNFQGSSEPIFYTQFFHRSFDTIIQNPLYHYMAVYTNCFRFDFINSPVILLGSLSILYYPYPASPSHDVLPREVWTRGTQFHNEQFLGTCRRRRFSSQHIRTPAASPNL